MSRLPRALRDTAAPLLRRIRLLTQRALVSRLRYSGKLRLLQIQPAGGEPIDSVEHLEPFGFTSHPPAGSEAICLAFGGNGSHTVVILVGDNRYRIILEEGEMAIYNLHGDKVHIKEDRSIAIQAALRVDIDSPEVVCTGTLTAQDVLTARGVSLDSHTHPGDSGGTTGVPNAGAGA